jgi:hypothetical protein
LLLFLENNLKIISKSSSDNKIGVQIFANNSANIFVNCSLFIIPSESAVTAKYGKIPWKRNLPKYFPAGE